MDICPSCPKSFAIECEGRSCYNPITKSGVYEDLVYLMLHMDLKNSAQNSDAERKKIPWCRGVQPSDEPNILDYLTSIIEKKDI